MRRIIDLHDMPEPPLDPPEETDVPVCPVCGEETDTFYKNSLGDVIGCDMCVSAVDAWEETA